jgi:hypothetical protein
MPQRRIGFVVPSMPGGRWIGLIVQVGQDRRHLFGQYAQAQALSSPTPPSGEIAAEPNEQAAFFSRRKPKRK